MWYELFQKSAAVSQRDVNAYRKYTGASNMNSAMDRWKTEQAMKGVRGEGLSNAAYRRAMAAQQQPQSQSQSQPETPVVSEAEQTWQPTPAPAPAAPKAPAVNFKPTTGQAVATALKGNTAPIAAMDPVAAQRNKEQRPQNVAELQQTYKPEMLPDYQTPTMAGADRISASILGTPGVRSLTNAVPTQAQAQQENMYQNYAANNKEHQNVLGDLREPELVIPRDNTPAVETPAEPQNTPDNWSAVPQTGLPNSGWDKMRRMRATMNDAFSAFKKNVDNDVALRKDPALRQEVADMQRQFNEAHAAQ